MNKLMIIGNVTKDPEMRTTQSGITVCSFNVAVNRRQNGQNGHPEADFFRVTAWRQLGEICHKYLAKGRKVAVVGQVSVSAYTGSDGQPKGSLEMTADDVEFLTPKDAAVQQEEAAYVREERQAIQQEAPQEPKQTGYMVVDDDDLPF